MSIGKYVFAAKLLLKKQLFHLPFFLSSVSPPFRSGESDLKKFSSDKSSCLARLSFSSCFCLHNSISPKKRKPPMTQSPAHAHEYSAPSGMTAATNSAAMTVKMIRKFFKAVSPFALSAKKSGKGRSCPLAFVLYSPPQRKGARNKRMSLRA